MAFVWKWSCTSAEIKFFENLMSMNEGDRKMDNACQKYACSYVPSAKEKDVSSFNIFSCRSYYLDALRV